MASQALPPIQAIFNEVQEPTREQQLPVNEYVPYYPPYYAPYGPSMNPQGGPPPPSQIGFYPSVVPDPLSGAGAEGYTEVTSDGDSVTTSSTQVSTARGSENLISLDADTKTAYEAYEIISAGRTEEVVSWFRLGPISIWRRFEWQDDDFINLNPCVNFSQDELSDLYLRKSSKFPVSCGKSYDQDLANRVNRLPINIYRELDLLIDNKTNATKYSPFRQREWNIVMLQEGEQQLTKASPQRRWNFLKFRREKPLIRRWFVVLQVKETKVSKEGWKSYNAHTNPWVDLDQRERRGLKEQ